MRMLNVLRFYVSTLRGSYTARNSEQGSEKKPFNPILGEVYLGKWPAEAANGTGETILVSEQGGFCVLACCPGADVQHIRRQSPTTRRCRRTIWKTSRPA